MSIQFNKPSCTCTNVFSNDPPQHSSSFQVPAEHTHPQPSPASHLILFPPRKSEGEIQLAYTSFWHCSDSSRKRLSVCLAGSPSAVIPWRRSPRLHYQLLPISCNSGWCAVLCLRGHWRHWFGNYQKFGFFSSPVFLIFASSLSQCFVIELRSEALEKATLATIPLQKFFFKI